MLSKSKINTLRGKIKRDRSEWESRFQESYYHLLMGFLFLESSNEILDKKQKMLPFAFIGYYYFAFHLGVALLALKDSLDFTRYFRIKEMAKSYLDIIKQKINHEHRVLPISHKKLKNLLESKFVQEKILDKKIIDTLESANLYRELVCYGSPDSYLYSGLIAATPLDEFFQGAANEAKKRAEEMKTLCQDFFKSVNSIYSDVAGKESSFDGLLQKSISAFDYAFGNEYGYIKGKVKIYLNLSAVDIK